MLIRHKTNQHSLTNIIITAASTDIPDPLSPFFPIVHRLWQVFM